jgi:putative transposase
MSETQEVRRGRHVVSALRIHLVFVPKRRRNVFDTAALEALRGIFAEVARDFGAELVDMDGDDSHVRLLLDHPPTASVSSLVNSLKGVSSRLLRKRRPDIAGRCWRGMLWSPSYFAASCGGAPINMIRQYIERQRTPDRTVRRP